MRSSAGKIQLASLDELFGTTQAPSEPFQEIPLSDLHSFKGHPFHVVDDEKMQELAESVAQHGVLVPGIVRPRPEGGYELISGHRRKRACELAGLAAMPRKDAIKLANYGLDRWLTLPRYIPEEDTRLLLKNCCRQYRQYSKVQTILKNNLISLLDNVFPNANRLFSSPARVDGSEKWVDFVAEFWHCKCVCERPEKAFINKYRKWCRKHGYNFSEEKARDIYSKAGGYFGVMPKSETTKLLVEQAVSQLRATSAALAALKQDMLSLASKLPEYPIVMKMFGVGPTLGPQLIAEIGDVRRFYSKKALVAYAGIDAPPNDSGDVTGRHKSMSKVGSSSLRRTLFLVMSVYLQNSPPDEPVYQFMDRKRAEGKPYRVYMMASANKFLRIYYATVKAYLGTLDHT